MSKQVGTHLPRSINQYVPNMEFAADIDGNTGEYIVNLGAPAAADSDGIWDGVTVTNSATTITSSDYKSTFDGSSTSLTSTAGKMDAPYGRCINILGDSGADNVVVISGRDYLGQFMSETFTLDGVTVQFGSKAFMYVDKAAVASGTASKIMDVGWTDRLGLPYKTQAIVRYEEDDVILPHADVAVHFDIEAVQYAAGVAQFVVSPVQGYVTEMRTTVVVTTTGEATLTVEIGGAAVTGLSVTIATSAGVGDLDSDTSTNAVDANGKIDKWEDIEIVSTSTPTGGAAQGVVIVQPVVFTAGVDTDPQTTSTDDPRGTILVSTICDGSVEYELRAVADMSDMHGVEQV